MSAFSGSCLFLAWNVGGTVRLDTDFHQFNWTPAVNYIETTAGADSFKEYILATGTPGDISWTGVLQSGGTAVISSLSNTTAQGTLIVGVEGTAANKPKLLIPCKSKGCSYKVVYNDFVEISATWLQTDAHTETAW